MNRKTILDSLTPSSPISSPGRRKFLQSVLAGIGAAVFVQQARAEPTVNCPTSNTCISTNRCAPNKCDPNNTCTTLNQCNPNECVTINNCAAKNVCDTSNKSGCNAPGNRCSVAGNTCQNDNTCGTINKCTESNECTKKNTCGTNTCQSVANTCGQNNTCTVKNQCNSLNACVQTNTCTGVDGICSMGNSFFAFKQTPVDVSSTLLAKSIDQSGQIIDEFGFLLG
jgi:hypothetical protein